MQNEKALDHGLTRPGVTLDVTRGAVRLMLDMGLSPILEFKLPNGRRADVAALDRKGGLVIIEVKSCQADFDVDAKWGEYLEFCDSFYFAVSEQFPMAVLPESEGLIIADGYGGAVIRPPEVRKLATARRKALTLRFARQAAVRSLRSGEATEE